MGIRKTDNSGLIQRFWNLKVLIALALALALLKNCYNNQEVISPDIETTSEVAQKTQELSGKTVTIRGKIQQKVGSSSFTVSDRQFFSVPIVVVNASAKPFDLPVNKSVEVQVTGLIRNLVISSLERDFNLRLPEQEYKNFINQPAIIAKSILLSPTTNQITSNPEQYYGTKLAVRGKVENIQSPVLFTLDNGQWFGTNDLLVLLNVAPKTVIKQGEIVEVRGVVRPFIVGDIERNYNITWNTRVKNQLKINYGNKPVLVAEAVNLSEILR
ncbi:hypothetical protein [Iningainema tapete]|uniref:Uncharacterized protein n=1 Tax=Iningainema tapete BLCC-T55 TaxID=2748662 RepID=A0A8J6XBE8_9CYAN|nr:hypothetical protein [Iningainema tapete]MBD2771579.1 hypothetical protein [Iningainema tapete BLCC-T55]